MLQHSDQGPLQARRQSIQQGMLSHRSGGNSPRRGPRHTLAHIPEPANRSRLSRTYHPSEDEDDGIYNDFTPLIKARRGAPGAAGEYGGGFSGPSREGRSSSRRKTKSRESSRSSKKKQQHNTIFERQQSSDSIASYDVNNPPSMPGSPVLGPDMGYDDVMLTSHEPTYSRSPEDRRHMNGSGDALIDIDRSGQNGDYRDSDPPSPTHHGASLRHRDSLHPAEGDVCFPQEGMSEIGEDDYSRYSEAETMRRRRRRAKKWPELSYLEEWSILEKEERTLGGIRSRKVSEPILIGGRLRPQKTQWHREEDDAPYRFTYFNEEFQNTVHAQTISELVQEGQTFHDLFLPEPPVLSDSSSDEEDETPRKRTTPPDDGSLRRQPSPTTTDGFRSRQQSLHQVPTQESFKSPSIKGKVTPPAASEDEPSRTQSPSRTATPTPQRQRQKRYGPRPVFWLDVMNPTDAEMRVLSKTFGIHPLTAEDIMTQEAREKVELFRHYYFVNYRTFEQDANNENYLEPVNMFVVVFREGVITVSLLKPRLSPMPGKKTNHMHIVSLLPDTSSSQRPSTYPPADRLSDPYLRLDFVCHHRRHYRCLRSFDSKD